MTVDREVDCKLWHELGSVGGLGHVRIKWWRAPCGRSCNANRLAYQCRTWIWM